MIVSVQRINPTIFRSSFLRSHFGFINKSSRHLFPTISRQDVLGHMGGVISIAIFIIPDNQPTPIFRMLEPQVYQLSVGQAFLGLTGREKLYAHYMAKYCSETPIWKHKTNDMASGLLGVALGLSSDKYPQKQMASSTS